MDSAELLKKTPLFSALAEKELAGLVKSARERTFAAGDHIIEEGTEGGQGFYLVLEGTAEVTKGGHHLADFAPGDYFGEMALLLDDQPRTASVVATSNVKVLVLTRWDFRALLKTHPDIGVKVMEELANRLRENAAEETH
jgi:CRP/FNR family cyclic AMP-dependent transcriptional regulator